MFDLSKIKVGIKVKYVVFISVLLVAFGAIYTVSNIGAQEEVVKNRLIDKAVTLAYIFEAHVVEDIEDLRIDKIREHLYFLRQNDEVIYTYVYDENGAIITDGTEANVHRFKVLEDEMSRNAVAADSLLVQFNENVMEVSTPAHLSIKKLGGIRIGFSLDKMKAEIADLQYRNVLFGIIFGVVGILLTFFLINQITKPVEKLIDGTRQLAKGNFDHAIEVDSADEFEVLANSFNNMTENLKDSREELIEAKEYNENILRSLNDTVIVLDSRLKIQSVNAATLKLLGYTEDELLGLTIDKISEQDGNGLLFDWDKAEKLTEERTIKNLERNYITKNGRRIPVLFSASIMQDDNKDIIGIVCTARDITERKEVLEKLKKSEKRLYKAQEVGKIGDWELDLRTGLVSGSPQSYEIVGMESSMGTHFTLEKIKSLAHPDDRPMLDKIMANFVNGKGKYDVEYRMFRAANDKMIVVNSKAELVRDDDGNPVKILGVIQDVTERKQVELELVKAKDIAEKSDRLKSEFLAQISHEIRTPVNSILSFTSLLKDEVSEIEDNDFDYIFELIEKGGRRLIRTIDLIINMSEIQTGSYEPNFESLDLVTEVVKPLYLEFRNQAQNKGLELVFTHGEESKIEIEADNYTLTQILANLIDNAIKYTHQGKVEIAVCVNNKNDIAVEVKDTGIGIKKEYLKSIFEPFTQEHQGYTREFEGNGLGLALVKKYCEVNHADIEVESEKGKGSIFRVKFVTHSVEKRAKRRLIAK